MTTWPSIRLLALTVAAVAALTGSTVLAAPSNATGSGGSAGLAPTGIAPTASKAASNGGSAPRFASGRYIVQLKEQPLARYDGGVQGFAATRPDAGDRLRVDDSDVRSYRRHLAAERDKVVGDVPGVRPLHDYDVAFNGFSAKLTGAQAGRLQAHPEVARVWKDETLRPTTTSSPRFLGLEGDDGVWSQQFDGAEHAGEGVIVGMVDSGFWPESKSFAPLPEPRPDQDRIDAKWNGDQVEGGSCWQGAPDEAEENKVTCNNKVIGARYYDAGATDTIDGEFASPRDYGGHGTHTSSTAAGDHGVDVTVDGESQGTASGMAPAARIAAYKVCWESESSGGCATSDSVAAIDQAVADGVDVLNYSISGSTTSVVSPVELAFLGAADAGVFVGASAGNAGPGSTVAHNGPWVTTVAASTHHDAEGSPAPEMAPFSSDGPALAGGGDLLKPDLTAPGQGVVAAVAPPGNDGADFAAYSGTSMSTPHVVGLAALLRSKRPDWSPMRIKSALMTTATRANSAGEPIQRGGQAATPLDYGAGHVDVATAFEPGLSYDASARDWGAYACSIEQAEQAADEFGDCANWPDIDPSDYNSASIAIAGLAHSQEVTRKVTNTGDRTTTYDVSVDAPAGTEVEVSPKRLLVPPGVPKSYTVKVTRTSAELDAYTDGSLTWQRTDGKGVPVNSPLVVEPVTLDAPVEKAGEGTDGSVSVEVGAGYDGQLEASATGLVPASVDELALKDQGEQFDPDAPAEDARTKRVDLTVPEGGLGRVATYADDYAEGTDLDLFLYSADGGALEPVGDSAQEGADETITVTEPGTYAVFVSLYSLPSGAELAVHANSWEVAGDQGNATVDPASQEVAAGDRASVELAWSGLEADRRYLGTVDFGDGSERLRRTLVAVDTGGSSGG